MNWNFMMVGMISIPILLGGVQTAQADDFRDCVAIVAMSDFTTKKAFQVGLNELIENERSDLKEIANLNMNLQIALARSRRMQLSFLLRSDPDRLDTNHGIVRFANFNWSSSDHTELVNKSVLYESVRSDIGKLKAQSNGHPDWPALRQFFTDKLSGHTAYKALVGRMIKEREAAASRLQTCRDQ